VNDFPKKNNVITITHQDKLPEAFEKIFSHNIHSAPVIDADGTVTGSISVVDIVLFCINVCQTGQEIVAAFGLPIESRMVNFDHITNYLREDNSLGSLFASDKATFITNYSKRESLPVVRMNTTLPQLLSVLSTSHRVVVCEGKNLQNYITQSDAVEFIHKRNLLGPTAKQTVDALQLATKKVVTINDTELVIEAFKKMVTEKVSGVGVVNDQNKLVGCVTAHDIRAITSTGELLEHLYETYSKYRDIMQTLKVPTKPQIIRANSSTTLEGVVNTIVKEKVHRVFLTDNNDQVSGVISLSDVLRCVSSSYRESS